MYAYSNPLSPAADKMHFIAIEPVSYEDEKIIAEMYMGIYTCWDETVDSYQIALSKLESHERTLKSHISGDIKRQLLIQSKHQSNVFDPKYLNQVAKSSTVGFKWLITGSLTTLTNSLAVYSAEYMDEKLELSVSIYNCAIRIDRKEHINEKAKKRSWISKLTK